MISNWFLKIYDSIELFTDKKHTISFAVTGNQNLIRILCQKSKKYNEIHWVKYKIENFD